MGLVTAGGWLDTSRDGNAIARAAGYQCTRPDTDEPEGRCRSLATHVYSRLVAGRRHRTACCPAHFEHLVDQHGPERTGR